MVVKCWSENAYLELKCIHDSPIGSPDNTKKIIGSILNKIDELHYTEHFQTDEIIGPPYRSIMINNNRVVYKVVDESLIEILDIFDNRQSPKRLQQRFQK